MKKKIKIMNTRSSKTKNSTSTKLPVTATYSITTYLAPAPLDVSDFISSWTGRDCNAFLHTLYTRSLFRHAAPSKSCLGHLRRDYVRRCTDHTYVITVARLWRFIMGESIFDQNRTLLSSADSLFDQILNRLISFSTKTKMYIIHLK
jgi:hypothetical protein